MTRRSEPTGDEDRSDDQHDGAPDWQVVAPRQIDPNHAGCSAQQRCQQHHRGQAIREEPRRCCRRDEQGQDQHVADRLNRDDHSQRHAHVEQQIEPQRFQPHCPGHLAIECNRHQRSVDHGQQPQHCDRGGRDGDQITLGNPRDRTEQEPLQRSGVPGSPRNDDQPERERSDQKDPDHRVFLDPSVLREQGNQHRGDDSTDRSTQDEASLRHEGHRQPREHRVCHGIADEGHASKHHMGPDDATDHRSQHRDDQRALQKGQIGVGQITNEIINGHGSDSCENTKEWAGGVDTEGRGPQVTDPGPSAELSWLTATRGSNAGVFDSFGRQVLLRGTNFNHLGDYFSTDPSLPTVATLDETDWSDAAAQGMNVVRLVTSWSAWEPVKDQIDLGYLARVRQAVADANTHGIYVVIDMHQDAWSKFVFTPAEEVCPAGTSHQIGWDGAPAWATMTDGYPTCTPGGRENSPAVRAAWENFYRNTGGIRNELAQLWGFIATQFAEDPGVAGFDLLNEPGYGFDQNITLVGLAQFYAAAITQVRAAELAVNNASGSAPGHIVFFEPTVNGPFVATEFSADPNLVFAPHNYGESIIGGGIPGFLELITGALQTLTNAYRTTSWIGEYGTFNSNQTEATSYMSRFNLLDDRNPGAGGTWWQWEQQCGDPHNANGAYPPSAEWLASQQQSCTESPRMNTPCTARSYPRAMPGRLDSVVAGPCGGALSVSGRTTAPSTAVLWFQSDSAVAPTVTGAGLGGSDSLRSRGGWRVTVQVSGNYQINLA